MYIQSVIQSYCCVLALCTSCPFTVGSPDMARQAYSQCCGFSALAISLWAELGEYYFEDPTCIYSATSFAQVVKTPGALKVRLEKMGCNHEDMLNTHIEIKNMV